MLTRNIHSIARIYPFGIAVSCTLLTWLAVVLHRAPKMELDRWRALRLLETMLVAGVAGALLWGGGMHFASFGGVFGSLAGSWLYFRAVRMETAQRWRYLDLLAYAFPFGWVCLRAGCALVHDHPGRLSDSWLAVPYPDGTRYDLGLLEMLIALTVACCFAVLGRRKRPQGFFLAWMPLCGPIRFALDMLRETPPSPWAAIALTAVSVWIAWRVRHRS